ncbi:MAG: hypothetical protein IT431_11535 [Phycisphaerales bacterium]|nr:hypothetical protein [Phycisphaerales bacterium]
MRKRKIPDYGEFAGAGFAPIDAEALAGLERLLHEWDTAPDGGRRGAAEEALREALLYHYVVNEFTTTDGRRVKFRSNVSIHEGVSTERLNAFLVANGERAYGPAEEWAKRLLAEGRALPDGFDEVFKVGWFMTVQ